MNNKPRRTFRELIVSRNAAIVALLTVVFTIACEIPLWLGISAIAFLTVYNAYNIVDIVHRHRAMKGQK